MHGFGKFIYSALQSNVSSGMEDCVGLTVSHTNRALCRIKLLPVTHVLVDMWMLTVKPVHKL